MGVDASGEMLRTLRWYLGRDEVEQDAARVVAGGPLAIVGGHWDDLEGFADRLVPERPVVDLAERVPSAREIRQRFTDNPETIVLGRSAEAVVRSLGVVVQPWYLPVAPLTARPRQAVTLLREAIYQLGIRAPLESLGAHVIVGLDEYEWPRGLHEIREASRRIGAVLQAGNVSAAARQLAVSRQAVSKYLGRRIARDWAESAH